MGISQYLVIVVSIALFLIPVSQVDAIFFIPSEIRGEEYYKNFNEVYNLKLEKLRDIYLEEYFKIKNPYNEKIYHDVIFNDKEFIITNSIHRDDENFQTLKDEQLDLAQKKYLEILGGKTITSSLGDKIDKRIIPILEFTSDEESIRKVIDREDEDFQTYKMQQVIIAENTIKRLVEEEDWGYVTDITWDDFNQNKDELKAALELIEDDSISSKRESQEFLDLIAEQILSAEKTRNIILNYSQYPNPYEENDGVIESDQEEITEKSEFNIMNRDTKGFEMVKTMELEIAQNTLNEMLMLSNSEENIQVEAINIKEENKKPKILDREDKGFEFLKKIQEDKAEKMLIEILGGKIISNFDVKTKVGPIQNLKTNQNDVYLSDYEKFQNYEFELIAIMNYLSENNEENTWSSSLYITSEKNNIENEIENKIIRDPNILCFGIGC